VISLWRPFCNKRVFCLISPRDGLPYCEKDYQRQFGVKCDHCERFIAGKVLQVTSQFF
jgi:actin-binding LIM protein